jgi:hypothetical protein
VSFYISKISVLFGISFKDWEKKAYLPLGMGLVI